jgi:type IV secretory pathway VirB2 component (pilin)
MTMRQRQSSAALNPTGERSMTVPALVLPRPSKAHLAKSAALLLPAMVLALAAGTAYAGTDATFTTALTKFTGFLQGSGGKIITVLSLAAGLISLASGRFTLGQIAVPVGVGVGVGTAFQSSPSVITAVI